MRLQSKESVTGAIWSSYSEEAVWQGAWWAPRLCSPCVLIPEESPDRRWHLFAHSWVGIEHFISSSGFDWKSLGLVVIRGHFPSIYREKNTWYLVYESHDKDYGGKRRLNMRKTISTISMISSHDLSTWSKSEVILSAADVPYASDYSPPRLSHPQIVSWMGSYRLYFCASEVKMYDTKQKVSACLSCAHSLTLSGSFAPANKPLIKMDPDSRYSNLGCGSFRFVACADSIVAFQTGFFFNEEKEKSQSAIILLSSDDGDHFKFEKELMTSPEKGWASRCFTSCSVSFKEDENTWYCYYSANGRAAKYLPVKEKLGLLIGNKIL